MKRFSDNYPDITPPNVISGGFKFDHPMEDEWDYYLASVFGDVETLAQIRAAHPQINGTMHYEFPLIMAVRNGRTDAVRFLLETEKDRNIDGDPPTNDNVWYSRCIDAAKQRGFDEIHTMLLETRERTEAHAKSQPPHQIDASLKGPLTEGDVAAVKQLLAEKPELTAASPDDQEQFMQWAFETEAKEKQVELVRGLIDSGFDPNVGKLVFQASQANNVPLAKLLLEKGADPNTEVDSCGNCMCWATEDDRHELRELLASYGGRMPVNYGDPHPTVDQLFAFDDERQQIWYASGEFLWIVLKTNDVEVLDRFVEHFGNEQIKTMSIQKHWFGVPSITFLNRLVEHGLNVNQRDWRGRSFIFSAGDNKWLQRYMELGADLNVVEFMECSTRLGYAAFHNNLEMAKLLLENGADPNLPMEHEWARPLTQAEKQGHTEMVELLKS